MYDADKTDKRKLLSALAHAAILFSATLVSIAIPVGILFISDDPVVKKNAQEAINFHLNVWLWGAVVGFLTWISFGLLGLIFGPIWFVWHWGLTIWAIVSCLTNPDQPFRYPLIFRVL